MIDFDLKQTGLRSIERPDVTEEILELSSDSIVWVYCLFSWATHLLLSFAKTTAMMISTEHLLQATTSPPAVPDKPGMFCPKGFQGSDEPRSI